MSDIAPVLAAAAVPVFSWSIVWYFHQIQSWLLYLSSWEILSIFAYLQAFALLESLFILLLVIVFAAMLPERLFRHKFAAKGSMMLFMATFWAVLFQVIFELVVLYWVPIQYGLWFGLALASIMLACVLVHRSDTVAKVVTAVADRLTVFLYIYLPLGILGILVVTVRSVL